MSQARLGGSLKNLESYLIKGDMRRCVLCNSEYTEGDEGVQPNIPRVLYCGCCMCEACIVKQIQKASLIDRQQNGAACQINCPICCFKNVFKLAKSGFLICNDRYIKTHDEKGLINYFPENKLSATAGTKQIFGGTFQLMDSSISIDDQLVLRSLPINVELIELIKKKPESFPSEPSFLTESEISEIVCESNQFLPFETSTFSESSSTQKIPTKTPEYQQQDKFKELRKKTLIGPQSRKIISKDSKGYSLAQRQLLQKFQPLKKLA